MATTESKVNSFEKLCALRASGKVVRWHTVPYWAGNRQEVSQHTFGVLLILCHICPEELNLSTNLLKAALYHDLAEQAIGDIPSPTKWMSGEFGTRLDDLEASVLKLLVEYDTPSTYERQLLMAADILDHCLVVTEQYAMGNIHVLEIMRRLKDLVAEKKTFQYIPKAQEVFDEINQIWNHKVDLSAFTGATAWKAFTEPSK